MKIAVSALLLSCLFFSCSKDNQGTEPESPATIVITKPLPTGIYVNGSTIDVEGEISDNNVLVSARVEIKNKSNGAVLYTATSNTGNVAFYRYDWAWTVTGIAGPTLAGVKIFAKDKLGNEVFKEVEVNLDN